MGQIFRLQHQPPDEEDASYVEWRVSEGNIAYWETVPSMIREQVGEAHSAYLWTKHVLRHLEASFKDGKSLWRETPLEGEEEPHDASTAPDEDLVTPTYSGPVVVLTDTTCGSACLDAMSLLTRMPEVVHVGNVTAADTQYMESRAAALPSGLATMVIPIKVYRDRVRPDGGYFTPEFLFEDLHWTDEALRAWVLSLWREGALEAAELEKMGEGRGGKRAERMMERMDANSDGKLALEEMQAGRDPARMFERLDTDKNGSLSAEEFAQARARHGEGRHGKKHQAD